MQDETPVRKRDWKTFLFTAFPQTRLLQGINAFIADPGLIGREASNDTAIARLHTWTMGFNISFTRID